MKGGKGLNELIIFGTFIGRFWSDGTPNMAAKGLKITPGFREPLWPPLEISHPLEKCLARSLWTARYRLALQCLFLRCGPLCPFSDHVTWTTIPRLFLNSSIIPQFLDYFPLLPLYLLLPFSSDWRRGGRKDGGWGGGGRGVSRGRRTG